MREFPIIPSGPSPAFPATSSLTVASGHTVIVPRLRAPRVEHVQVRSKAGLSFSIRTDGRSSPVITVEGEVWGAVGDGIALPVIDRPFTHPRLAHIDDDKLGIPVIWHLARSVSGTAVTEAPPSMAQVTPLCATNGMFAPFRELNASSPKNRLAAGWGSKASTECLFLRFVSGILYGAPRGRPKIISEYGVGIRKRC